jgi:hypothetical protein
MNAMTSCGIMMPPEQSQVSSPRRAVTMSANPVCHCGLVVAKATVPRIQTSAPVVTVSESWSSVAGAGTSEQRASTPSVFDPAGVHRFG